MIIGGQCTIGSHCDIRANTNIRATTTIGDYVFIGERVHVGASRDGGSDDPLWIKSYSYISPGSTVHATRVDAEAYYGANVTTDYGSHIGEGTLLLSGASVRHDERIRDRMIFEGNPGLQRAAPGISEAQMMEAVGFQPRKWLTEVMGPALEKSETYEDALNGWEHFNKGTIKGQVQPGATLVGNVHIGEGTKVYAGAYLEGNINVGKSCAVVVDVMIVSNDAIIGDHTHIYDKAMIVDGRPADKVRVGLFNWINHLAALQGTTTGDFAISNIGVSAAYGTEIGPEALLLNNSATYAGQKLPAGSISWGEPARVRVLDSTMWEREFFFYGKSFPTWDRQATAEELKTYKLPR